jgi:hypothetical protein
VTRGYVYLACADHNISGNAQADGVANPGDQADNRIQANRYGQKWDIELRVHEFGEGFQMDKLGFFGVMLCLNLREPRLRGGREDFHVRYWGFGFTHKKNLGRVTQVFNDSVV